MLDITHKPLAYSVQSLTSLISGYTLGYRGSSKYELTHSVQVSQWVALVRLKRGKFTQDLEHLRA